MKRTTTLILLLIVQLSMAQVGIGTEDPQTDLDVNGTLLVQDEFKVNTLNTVKNSDEDFMLLTRVTNSDPVGELTVLNVDSLTVAPINVVDYKFTNIKLDNLTNVDLQFDSDKYIVGVSNFRYIGPAVKKIAVGTTTSIGAFVVRTFIENGTWHIEIRNRFLDPLEIGWTEGLRYEVSLIVYDKSYFRNLPVIVTNLNGSNSGSASSIPNL